MILGFIKKPRLTVLRYKSDPRILESYLADFTEGSQFQMSLSFLHFRGEVKTYKIDYKARKVIVTFNWLYSIESLESNDWKLIEPQELELNFVTFYLQQEGRVKLWTKRPQVVGYFFKKDDPTNIKHS